MKHRVALLLVCACSALTTPVFRAQSAPPAGRQPEVTFQLEVNYVDVDAVVTDQQGNFVRGLTRDDFQLFEDGKPQKIELFSAVDIPVERRNPVAFAGRQIREDVKSNIDAFAGRVYVLVLDDLNTSAIRSTYVKRVARQFVQQNLGANDVAAVVNTSGLTDASQNFTSDSQRLLTAVDKFLGQKLRSATLDSLDSYYQQVMLKSSTASDSGADPAIVAADPTFTSGAPIPSLQLDLTRDSESQERGFRAQRVLNELRDLADFLASVRGRRKALILFSEGIDYPVNDLFTGNQSSDVRVATREAIAAAARSNVSFFTVDPRGLVGMSEDTIALSGAPIDHSLGLSAQGLLDEMRVSQDSLRTLADQTGGFAAVNANNLTAAFERIVHANSTYYVLGYYPPTQKRDGKFHQIEVRLKRPGLRVDARKGYAEPRGKAPQDKPKDAARAKAAANASGAISPSPELNDVLKSPMQQAGLTMFVQAAPFRGTDKEASVALSIDIDASRLHFKPAPNNAGYANDLELSFFGLNQDGKAIPGATSLLTLNLRPETYRLVQVGGLRLNPRVQFAPGRYQLRVGVRESGSGDVGSVFYDLDVPDFSRNSLMMSGMLLTSFAQAYVPSAAPDKIISRNELIGPATSRRDFVQGDTLDLFVEIYDNASSSSSSTGGRQIEVVTRLTGSNGREVFNARDTLGASLPPTNATATTFGHSKQISLKDVSPGTYLLQIQAAARGGSNQTPVAVETVVTVHQPVNPGPEPAARPQ